MSSAALVVTATLTLSTLGKIFSRRHFEIFFLFFPEKETICMKCQILFSGKNKKNNIILSSAENAQRVVKVNAYLCVKFSTDDILK